MNSNRYNTIYKCVSTHPRPHAEEQRWWNMPWPGYGAQTYHHKVTSRPLYGAKRKWLPIGGVACRLVVLLLGLMEVAAACWSVAYHEGRLSTAEFSLELCRERSTKEICRTRKKLYGRIWSRPIRANAKDLALSDVCLAKLCRRSEIPLPPQGYWSVALGPERGRLVEPLATPGAGDRRSSRLRIEDAEVVERLEVHVGAPGRR